LALALRFSEHFSFLLNHLELAWLTHDEYRDLYKNLVIYYNQLNDQWTQSAPNIWDTEPKNNVADLATSTSAELTYEGFRSWLDKFANTDPVQTAAMSAVNNVNNQAALLDRLSLLAEKEYYQYSSETAKTELIRLARLLKKNNLARELKNVETRLAEAESSGQAELTQSLLEEFKILSEELRDITL